MAQVKQENPDLIIKTLENNAFNLFGETLAKHLKKCWANKSKESKEQNSKSSTPTVQTKEDTSMNLDFDFRDLADFRYIENAVIKMTSADKKPPA